MKKLYLILLILITFFYNCSTDIKENKNVKKPNFNNQLNISILIDLSDRITKINQIEIDKEIIHSVVDFFKSHIESKRIFFIKDKIRVLFYPESQNDKISSIAESLNISFDPNNKDELKEKWENLIDTYDSNINSIYEIAISDGEKNDYPGSDIWRFFKNKVVDYCIDGYFSHTDPPNRSY